MDIDPNILNIILGLITNGLTSLITQLGKETGKQIIGKRVLEKWDQEKTALEPILKKAISSMSEGAEWTGPAREEIVSLFLLSPEVEAIVRQIYAAKLLEEEEQANLESIQEEFYTFFALFLGSYSSSELREEESFKSSVKSLFNALIHECELALSIAVDNGILAAHEAKSSFRYRLILDEISIVHKNLDLLRLLLTKPQEASVKNISKFEEQYRYQVSNRHGYITLPHLDTARRVPINNLYVSPSFASGRRVIEISDFLSKSYRVVLLGNPGGGKSTFTLKLCNDIAQHYSERLLAERQKITPILVILRDYGTEKKAHNYSILQFIETKARANYQLTPPFGAFEYLLLNGRAVVIFDGLDELLDTSYRREISSDVESFCTLYPSIPVLVTSRQVGYEQAPLDENMFNVFQLAPFNEEQTREYVNKWFAVADPDLMLQHPQQKAETFLEESQTVSDLCSNPLMLALICNIYRGENYIPKNRPDVYEKCAVMLFDRWDKSRGIHIIFPFEAHIRAIMEYLAYWIYSDEKLWGGVTEGELIAKATEYLHDWRFEDYNEAEKAAREFIEFCKGRAWVFTDTGTTNEGERLYQFTHTTFLEYFAASHLIRIHRTPNALINTLLLRIAKREWDVVAQLAFQLQNKKIAGAGDELLTMLIEQANGTQADEKWSLLSFAVRCLSFIVPRPKISRNVALSYIEYFLTWSVDQEKRSRNGSLRLQEQILRDLLLNTSFENRAPIADTIEKTFIEKINSSSEIDASIFLEIGLYLVTFLYSQGAKTQSEILKFWKEVSDHIFDACSDKIVALSPNCFWLCNRAVLHGNIDIADFVKWHSAASFFKLHHFTKFHEEKITSLAEELLGYMLGQKQAYIANYASILRDVGDVLLTCKTPWVDTKLLSTNKFYSDIARNMFETSENLERTIDCDAQGFFSVFVLFAIFFEVSLVSGWKLQMIESIRRNPLPNLSPLHWTLLAHFERVGVNKVRNEMKSCDFTREQQVFAWQWIQREIHFLS